MMDTFLRFLVVALCLAVCGPTAGFGGLAHRMVGDLADASLAEPTRSAVLHLLEGEPQPTLAAVSTWADDVRAGDDPRFEGTAPWHYVNFPRDCACRYRRQRDCVDGACIIEALNRQAAILGDRGRPPDQRREALKWVVHLVGDIHQPLHAGFGDDRGGNLFQLNYIGQGTNLHAVWDRLVFEAAGLTEAEYVDALRAREAPAAVAWHAGAAAAWAEESCRMIAELDLYPRRQGRLNRAYLERMRPHAEARVLLAGARLAALLDAVLGTAAGSAAPDVEPDVGQVQRGLQPAPMTQR